jgi:DNA-directed RNA polymerase sigma subunit (sigma70/sigma32)
VNKIKNEFFLLNGRYPTVEEIMEELEMKYSIVIKDEVDLYDVVYNSINSSLDEGETFYEESAEFNQATSSYNDYEKTVNDEYNQALVGIMLNGLTEKEQKVIKPLFGIGCEEQSMETIAEEMGMTKERIRQLKISICEKLKKQYDGHYKKKAI